MKPFKKWVLSKKREEFQKEAKEKYQNLSEEKKKKPNMQVKFIKIFLKKEKVKNREHCLERYKSVRYKSEYRKKLSYSTKK